MAPKMGEGGQIWLKCITGNKNNIFEKVKKNHADLAWNYPNIWPKLPLSSQIVNLPLPIAMR